MPEWGPNVMRHWRDVLQGLARNPLDYATRLDSYAKLMILQHEVQRAGMEWREVREALQRVDELRRLAPHESVLRAIIAESPRGLPEELRGMYDDMGAIVHAAGPRALDQLRFALRLQVLDLKYHELGGIYDQMAESGRFDSVVLGSAEIDRAMVEAPPGGQRARPQRVGQGAQRATALVCELEFCPGSPQRPGDRPEQPVRDRSPSASRQIARRTAIGRIATAVGTVESVDDILESKPMTCTVFRERSTGADQLAALPH